MKTTTWYGGCGVAFCADCLPLYDAQNNPIGNVPPQVFRPGQATPAPTAHNPEQES